MKIRVIDIETTGTPEDERKERIDELYIEMNFLMEYLENLWDQSKGIECRMMRKAMTLSRVGIIDHISQIHREIISLNDA